MIRVGIAQAVIVLMLTIAGGKRFWTFGLRPEHAIT